MVRRSDRKSKGKRRADYEEEEEEVSEDPLEELTRPQLLLINHVFDSLASSSTTITPASGNPSAARHETHVEHFEEGGFVVDDDEATSHQPGGFFVDEWEPTKSPEREILPTPIKLSNHLNIQSIPEALQLLDLPYKNTEILDVFENAASTDEDEDEQQKSNRPKLGPNFGKKQKMISRIKFSKICAVLMISRNADGENSEPDEDDHELLPDDDRQGGRRRNANAEYTGDYQAESDQPSSASDYHPDDAPGKRSSTIKTRQSAKARDYSDQEPAQRSKRSKRGAKKAPEAEGEDGSGDEDEDGTSGRQNSVLDTFSLFFESTILSGLNMDVSDRTIGFEEIKWAADKLGEKLTDKEIQEMLDYASYTNDSRVTIQAFEKLMKETRTV